MEDSGADHTGISQILDYLPELLPLSDLVLSALDEVCVCPQARDVRNNEVVAIKKMSYSGKQTNEVTH